MGYNSISSIGNQWHIKTDLGWNIQLSEILILFQLYWKDKNKEKEAGSGQIIKRKRLVNNWNKIPLSFKWDEESKSRSFIGLLEYTLLVFLMPHHHYQQQHVHHHHHHYQQQHVHHHHDVIGQQSVVPYDANQKKYFEKSFWEFF